MGETAAPRLPLRPRQPGPRHGRRPIRCATRSCAAGARRRWWRSASALTAARMYPTLKYALGHGKACSKVDGRRRRRAGRAPGRWRRRLAAMDAALTDAFEANRPRLTRLAYRMLGSVAEAEDVVQDAWLRWTAGRERRRRRPGRLAGAGHHPPVHRPPARGQGRARGLSRALAARAADRAAGRGSGRAGRGRLGGLPAGAGAAVAAGAGGLPAARRVRRGLRATSPRRWTAPRPPCASSPAAPANTSATRGRASRSARPRRSGSPRPSWPRPRRPTSAALSAAAGRGRRPGLRRRRQAQGGAARPGRARRHHPALCRACLAPWRPRAWRPDRGAHQRLSRLRAQPWRTVRRPSPSSRARTAGSPPSTWSATRRSWPTCQA